MNVNIKIFKKRSLKLELRTVIFSLFSFLFALFSFAQEITTAVDTTTIKIGEEVKLQILIKANPTDLIIFPETKKMGLLEVINSYKADTLLKSNPFTLKKEYGLTQFDSGHYTLPPQKIIINGKPHFTDSLLVEVRDVVVDTTKQKLYDIKPIIEVEKPSEGVLNWILYSVLGLLLLGAIMYFLFFRKTKAQKEAENKLPPFEEAISQLNLLKETGNSLLEEGKYKEYYSQLTDVLKHYLDEEVYEDALESTTDELLEKLELLRDSGKLPISKEAITNLRNVLQTSDLVKFAKSKPDSGTAKVDRNTIENIITETKAAIPEPTEEELWLDEQYRLEQAKQAKRKKNIRIALVTAGILLLSIVGLGFKYGFSNIKDAIFAPQSKQLLEGSWVRSEYGNPAIIMSTPKVLKRTSNAEMEAMKTQSFAYGNLGDNLAIVLNTLQLPKAPQMSVLQNEDDDAPDTPKVDLEQVNEQTLQMIEQQGATNLLVKQAKYAFPDDVEGMKAFGTFTFKNPITKQNQQIAYEVLSFTQDEVTIQQVMVFYNENDKYAKKVAAKVLESVELKKDEE